MGFVEDLIRELETRLEEDFHGNKAELARELGVNEMQIHHLLSGQRMQYLKKYGQLIDNLGGKVVFPGDDFQGVKRETAKQVVNNLLQIPEVYSELNDLIENMVQARTATVLYGDGLRSLCDMVEQLPDIDPDLGKIE
jgi:hypothetical protein